MTGGGQAGTGRATNTGGGQDGGATTTRGGGQGFPKLMLKAMPASAEGASATPAAITASPERSLDFTFFITARLDDAAVSRPSAPAH